MKPLSRSDLLKFIQLSLLLLLSQLSLANATHNSNKSAQFERDFNTLQIQQWANAQSTWVESLIENRKKFGHFDKFSTNELS